MVIETIPAINDFPWYTMKISLAGVVYTLRFRYNTRMNRWIIDVADASDNDILNGIPILIRRYLIDQYVIPTLPNGSLFCWSNDNQQSQPDFNSFPATHTIFFADLSQ